MARDNGTLSKEFFVGLFVATGLALLIFFVFSIGGVREIFQPTKKISVKFDYLGGLKAGQPVLYSGYQVGRVQSVEIQKETEQGLLVTISLPADLPVYKNSNFMIASSGIIGDRVLEIESPEKPGEPVEGGEVLEGTDPVNMAKILGQFQSMFDDQANQQFKSLLANAHRVSEDFVSFSEDIRSLTARNEEDVDQIISNLSSSSENVQSLLARADTTSRALKKIADDFSHLTQENRPQIQSTIKNLEKTSENIKKFSEKIRQKPWRILW